MLLSLGSTPNAFVVSVSSMNCPLPVPAEPKWWRSPYTELAACAAGTIERAAALRALAPSASSQREPRNGLAIALACRPQGLILLRNGERPVKFRRYRGRREVRR